MAGIDEVLERLVNDTAFRDQLSSDPDLALGAYTLSEEDRTLLAARFSSDAGGAGRVEQRTSKSALAGLIGAMGSKDTEPIFKGEIIGMQPAPSGGVSEVNDEALASFEHGDDPSQIEARFNPKEISVSKDVPWQKSSDAPLPSDLANESSEAPAHEHRVTKVDQVTFKSKIIEGGDPGEADALQADPASSEDRFDGKYNIASATHRSTGAAEGATDLAADDDEQAAGNDWYKRFVIDGKNASD